MARIYCPRCEALAINGTPCHESGCPNENKRWEFRGRGDKRHCIPRGEDTPRFLLPEVAQKRIREAEYAEAQAGKA